MAYRPKLPLFLTLGAAAVTLLGGSLPAQIGEEEEVAIPARIRLRDKDLLAEIAESMGADPSKLKMREREGEPYGFSELRLMADGSFDYSFLETEYEESMIADTFAEVLIAVNMLVEKNTEQYDAMASQLKMMVGPMLAMGGADAQATARTIDNVLAMPKEIAAVFVRVMKDPRKMEKGTQVFIDIVPRPETDLQFWIRRLTPNPQGAPVISTNNALFDVAMSLDPDVVKSVLGPFVDAMNAFTPGTKEARAENLDYAYRFLGLSDGTAAMTVDASGRTTTILGVQCPEEYSAGIAEQAYVDWWTKQLSMNDMVDASVEQGALDHRETKAMKVTVDLPAGVNPLSPEGGETVGYRGVVAGYDVEVAQNEGAEGAFKALADAILDGKLKRAQLPMNQVVHRTPPTFRAVVDLDGVLEMIPPGTLPEPIRAGLTREGGPDKLIVSVGKVGITLKLALELQ